MPISVAPTDFQTAVSDRSTAQPNGDDNDGTELAEEEEAEGLE
jgi:hypothetical protein